jgi:hypothetical protein
MVGSTGFIARTSARYEPQIGLERRALLGGGRRRQLGAEPGDLPGNLPHVVLDALEALLHHRLAGELVGDDLGARIRRGVDLVAVPVVPVEMGVDDVAHRPGRDVAEAVHDHPRRGGLGVGVHDHRAVVALDDRGVGVDLVGGGGDRDVDAVGHPAEIEAGVAPRALVTATVHGALSSPGDTMRRREPAQASHGRPR